MGGGAGEEEGELHLRDIQCVDMFITVADLDVGRSKKNKGGEKKKKNATSPCIQARFGLSNVRCSRGHTMFWHDFRRYVFPEKFRFYVSCLMWTSSMYVLRWYN